VRFDTETAKDALAGELARIAPRVRREEFAVA